MEPIPRESAITFFGNVITNGDIVSSNAFFSNSFYTNEFVATKKVDVFTANVFSANTISTNVLSANTISANTISTKTISTNVLSANTIAFTTPWSNVTPASISGLTFDSASNAQYSIDPFGFIHFSGTLIFDFTGPVSKNYQQIFSIPGQAYSSTTFLNGSYIPCVQAIYDSEPQISDREPFQLLYNNGDGTINFEAPILAQLNFVAFTLDGISIRSTGMP